MGGTYYRTYMNSGSGPNMETDPALVSNLRLDKYLVTVGRFRQFVRAFSGGYIPSTGAGKHTYLNGGQGLENSAPDAGYEMGWNSTDWSTDVAPTSTSLQSCQPDYTWTSTPGAQENLPIDCVNWYEAYAFCIWDGGFLPSEAEWEYAAAGGSQQREYPWGSTPPGTSNQYAIYGGYYTHDALLIAPVGMASLGAGSWGQLDLAGEVLEWVLDWSAPYAVCTNCAYLSGDLQRVARGGYTSRSMPDLQPWVRDSIQPAIRGVGLGFRCARAP
jgi:formylglycine-generating enzyme required for sulfatase activity